MGFNNLFVASIIFYTGKMSLNSYDTSPLGDFSTLSYHERAAIRGGYDILLQLSHDISAIQSQGQRSQQK